MLTLHLKCIMIYLTGGELVKITLKAARVNKGFTQKMAANKLGVTKDTISNWERGKSYPDALRIKEIEKLYEVNYNDIFFTSFYTLSVKRNLL